MNKIRLKFSSNDVGINPNAITDNKDLDLKFKKMFIGRIDKKSVLRIDSFIDILEKNGWKIKEKNPDLGKYTNYIFSKNKFSLDLIFPKEYDRNDYRDNYERAQKKLLKLSKKAKIVGQNVTNIDKHINTEKTITEMQNNDYNSDNNYGPKLIIDNTTKVKKYMPSLRKLFKDHPKLAIALCTLGAAATVAAGGFIIHTVAVRVEAKEVIDNNKKYSYHNNQESDSINYNRQLIQQFNNGYVDDSLVLNSFEEMKMNQNEETYQRTR